MLKFHFLGTLSGTEPFPDMHHSSWILEVDGLFYWFEAGENCVHRAYASGLDVMQTAALFVSHPHLDHIGGMANLLACIQKLEGRYNRQLVRDNTLQIYFPDVTLLPAIQSVACGTTNYRFSFGMDVHQLTDGRIFEDGNLRVTAHHNLHIKEDGSSGWHSFSFLLEADQRRIVFSGDVRHPEELDPLIGDGCDLLIMETGHHRVEDVCCYAVSHRIPHLRLTHHGREIIENRPACERLIADWTAAHPICIRICSDGMTEEF